MSIAKVIEIIGKSDKSWEDATKEAVETASKTIRNIKGVEVIGQTANVKDGKIISYKSTVKIVFKVEE